MTEFKEVKTVSYLVPAKADAEAMQLQKEGWTIVGRTALNDTIEENGKLKKVVRYVYFLEKKNP